MSLIKVKSRGTDNVSGRRNLIINGAMLIAQRGTSATVTNSADYLLVDRFKHYRDSGGTLNAEQSTVAPTGFSHSYKLTATSGVTASSSQLNFFQQIIEGNNAYQLHLGTSNASKFTVSFWVRSSVTGTYSIAVGNGATNRSLVRTYSISTADTWEHKTFVIQGDTTGTWLSGTSAGLRLWFNLGSGSNYDATENVWNGSLKFGTSGTTDWFSNTGATFYLTGVQIEVGDSASDFEHRQFGEELALCQRYYQTFQNGQLVGTRNTGTRLRIGAATRVDMRANPTVGRPAGTTVAFQDDGSSKTSTNTSPAQSSTSTSKYMYMDLGGFTGVTNRTYGGAANYAGTTVFTADAEL